MPTRTLGATLAAGLLAAAFAAPALSAGAMPAPLTSAGCVACHTVDKKLLGPAYKDVAAKYKGQADAATLLAGHVRAGSKGVWGPVPMPPHPVARISDADLAAGIAWILQQ